MVDEDRPRLEAYRLERIQDGRAVTIAVFYSAAEALTVMGSLTEGYRLMRGEMQIWPSSSRHDDDAG